MLRLGADSTEDAMMLQVTRLQQQVDDVTKERDTLNTEFNEYKQEATSVAAPIHVELKRAVEELAVLKPEAEKLREAAGKIPTIDPEIASKYEALDVEAVSMRAEVTRLRSEREATQEAHTCLARELHTERTTRFDTIKQTHSSYSKAREQLEAQIEALTKDKDERDRGFWQSCTDISQLQARTAKAERQLKEGRAAMDAELASKTEAIEKSNAELKQRNDALVAKMSELTEKNVQLQQQARAPPPPPAAPRPKSAAPAPQHIPATASTDDLRVIIATLQKEKHDLAKKCYEMEQSKRDLKNDNEKMRVLLRNSGALPSGQEMQKEQQAVASQRKQEATGGAPPVVAAPAEPRKPQAGDLCEYLTNEAGWREGKILGHNPAEKVFKIEDVEKKWVLDTWPEEHVKLKPIPVPAAPAPEKKAFAVGQKVDALFDGKWFECVINAVKAEASTCDVTWSSDQSFTPSLPFDQIKAKPPLPPAAPKVKGGGKDGGKKGGKKGKKGGKGGKPAPVVCTVITPHLRAYNETV